MTGLKRTKKLYKSICETLFKSRPQLYDKKPDIDNDDHTTWYKESGLIAQEAVLSLTKKAIRYHYLKYRHQ